MNAIALLLALLVVAYIGSSLSVARGVRGYGLPSGVEYVLLGAALGPSALGIVDRASLAALTPVVVFALGWIALEQGAEFGFVAARRVPLKRVVIGCVLSGGLAVAVAVVVHAVLLRLEWATSSQRLLAGVGVALVSCEATRHALRRVNDPQAAQGPLSQLIADIASADVAVPLVALAWWFAFGAPQPGTLRSFELSSLMALSLGVVLGLLVIALLKTTVRAVDAWGVLLGGALIGVGVAHGSGMSWMTALFAMGITLSFFPDQRLRVRAKLEQTEHAVLLPILAVAGAHIEIQSVPDVVLILPVVFLVRALFTLLVGGLARAVSATAAGGGSWLGPSLWSSGALTVCIGFACSLHVPGSVGQMILVAAVVDTLVGEMLGPVALLRALRRAQEQV